MSHSGEDPDHDNTPTADDDPISDAADDLTPDDDDYADDDEEEELSEDSKLRAQRAKMENLFHRISNEPVPLRVHDVLIKGNSRTKESLIEAEIEILKEASSVQELLKAASIVNARLQQLDIFDSVNITLDSGPSELPGTTNVIVEVVEPKNPFTGDIGLYSKPQARTWSLESALKLKNFLGYGDLWDSSLIYGWDQMSELSAGVCLPRFKGIPFPVTARASLFSQDWLKFSSYKEKDDLAGEDKKYRLRKALGQTAEWFSKALAVERVKGNLQLSGYSACGQDGGVQLPREYVEEGVADADLVLLVTTRPTTGNTLAWAVACERDQWGRAIAGHVNVAPRHLTAVAETLLSATLIHEVMHVLGFDPHAFAHFRDERKRRRSQVTQYAMDEKLGRMVTRVVLPRVVMHSRHHFGTFSENFTGLELEDGGGRGTSGSHWEKRLLMNEIMTGSVDTRSVVSRMTLALLEDSGWYRANYNMADRLDWGRNQGTEFVTSPCNLWKGAYHCNTTQSSGCTFNREAEGYCPIVYYNGDLPHWARYFPQANKGGQSSLADYCTYFVAYSDGSCTDVNSARPPDRMLGEVRGSSSRCMASSLVRAGFVRGSSAQGNGCYQHRCRNNSLEIAVDGSWKVCPEAGGPIQFSGFNGELVCPAYHELCSVDPVPVSGQCPNSCHFNGDCVHGRCHCFLGFRGPDCGKRSCPRNCSGHGKCLTNGVCECDNGHTGIDCSTAVCDEQCSLHGGVCDNGVCEFRCSDYAGYTCRNSSIISSSLLICKDVLGKDASVQHCAPGEQSILQQLEEVVVKPNYHRLFPGGPRKIFNYFRGGDCDGAARRLACWISIQKCDEDGDNRLRVCHSVCQSYNKACGATLDCSDQTLFSNENEGAGLCTGYGKTEDGFSVF